MDQKKNVIALGFFDGVHRGHQALLKCAVERGQELNMTPAVFTFDRSPKEFVSGIPVPLISSSEERREVVRRMFPIEEVFIVPFDREMMTMDWVDFVLVLAQKYNAGHLVAGHDFRFGDIIPAVMVDGIPVSSTHIRSLLQKGEMVEAARFLGYPYTMTGKVRHGKGLGRKIGAPTLNLIPSDHQLIPAYGVYATRVSVDGYEYGAVTNVGVRPTVDQDGGVTVESHLIDVNAQLYGSKCRVEFLKRLRGETKFESLDALQAQIANDIAEAKEYLEK